MSAQTHSAALALADLVALIIPALNEAEALPPVLEEALALSCIGEIIVVDDGSTDGTADVVRKIGARDPRVRVISHPSPRGNGAAVKTGLAAEGVSKWAAVLDADGQHPPRLLAEMVNKLRSEQLEMVVAARDFRSQGGGTPRSLSNRFISAFASWLMGKEIPDITSGYRVADRMLLKRFHRLYPDGFSFPLTSTIAFVLAGYRVGFIPYQGVARTAGSSKISWWRDGRRFFTMLFRLSLWCPMRTFLVPAVFFLTTGALWTLKTVIVAQAVGAGGILLLMIGLACFLGGLILQQLVNLRLDVLAWLDTASDARKA
jgi:glycosyltransferase involved in cell wall biosynthesis